MNASIFSFFYNLSNKSKRFDKIVAFVTHILPYLIVLFIFLSFFSSRTSWEEVVVVSSATFTAWIISLLLKITFRHARPLSHKVDTLFISESRFSFPSEHSAIFSALAFSALHFYYFLGFVLVFLALIIGISRIVVGAHYPKDVLIGWLLGFLVALFFIKIF